MGPEWGAAMTRSVHPCLSCRLPDCEDNSPGCPLRRAANRFKRTAGAEREALKSLYNVAYRELYYDAKSAKTGRAPRDIVAEASRVERRARP